MYEGKLVFAQLMDHLPMHTLRRTVARFGGDRWVKSFSCQHQFRAMAFAQLNYRESLRDIEICLSAQASKLYHMGFREPVKRSTLADANETHDWRIYAEFAQRLIALARKLYADEDLGLDLKNSIYALDSTTIDLCLSVFPWAHFRTTKSAVKMHTLLDLRGNIPSFIHISDGKLHDVNALDLLVPEAGAIYVMDRGYACPREGGGRFCSALRSASGRRLLGHTGQVKHGFKAGLLGAVRPGERYHLRSDHRAHGRPDSKAIPRASPADSLQGCRHRQDVRVPHQPAHAVRHHHLRLVQKPSRPARLRHDGRSSCSSSGSSSICASRSSTARPRTR